MRRTGRTDCCIEPLAKVSERDVQRFVRLHDDRRRRLGLMHVRIRALLSPTESVIRVLLSIATESAPAVIDWLAVHARDRR